MVVSLLEAGRLQHISVTTLYWQNSVGRPWAHDAQHSATIVSTHHLETGFTCGVTLKLH